MIRIKKNFKSTKTDKKPAKTTEKIIFRVISDFSRKRLTEISKKIKKMH